MKRPISLAVSVLLVSSMVGAAPAQAVETATISGVLTDAGAPAAGIRVTVEGPSHLDDVTAADGSWRVTGLQPGDYYRVAFHLGGAVQYAPRALHPNDAQIFKLVAGQEVTVNDSLLPRGSMAGRFTDFDGSPVAGAQIWLFHSGGNGGSARTDADGRWRVDQVFAATYRVEFQHWQTQIAQRAYGKPEGLGDPIVVTAGGTTTVDDVALARTSVRITAKNSVTGEPIQEFSADIPGAGGYTDNGVLMLDGVHIGQRSVHAYAMGYLNTDAKVTLVAGQQGNLEITMAPEAAIQATVVDAATGAPVSGVCVRPLTWADATFSFECDETSDEQGQFRMSYLKAGVYQVFAMPSYAEGYGAQWVGANGGTGRQASAKQFQLDAGETEAVTIRLDRAGAISGTVRTSDGSPIDYGRVSLLGGDPLGGGAATSAAITPDGSYTIDFAGPYEWPVLFEVPSQGFQWSGQTGNRHLAKAVKGSYDFTFRKPVRLNATVTGVTANNGMLIARDVLSGDVVGWVAGDMQGTGLSMPIVGPCVVRFEVLEDETWITRRSGPVFIPSSGTKSITVNF